MVDHKLPRKSAPIAFGRHVVTSEVFRSLFREGMGLVEETAAYLDGHGREESRRLGRAGSLTYATDSMRLTTRLMQLASWLLLQRAVNEGQMSAEQANSERSKVKLGGLATATDGPDWQGLPYQLRQLILRSISLQDKIVKLNRMLDAPEREADNPVALQLGRLAAAFSPLVK
jgi:regulator of CtrA degradation